VTPWAPPDIHGPSTMFVERPTAPSLSSAANPFPLAVSSLTLLSTLPFAMDRPACVFPLCRSTSVLASSDPAFSPSPLPSPLALRTRVDADDRRACEMEYRRTARACTCVRDDTKESLTEKDAGGGGSTGRKRWGDRGKDKEEQEEEWLVGEDDGGLRKGQEGPCCAVLHKSISRGCINTTQ